MAGAAAACTVAGIAVAGPGGSPPTVSTVSATFAATAVSDNTSTTCTGGDGNYTVTRATYTGTATSSDAHLSGPIVIRVDSVVNTSTNRGWLRGNVRVSGSPDGTNADGQLQGVISGTQFQGYLTGHEHGPKPPKGSPPPPPPPPGAQLLGGVSAGFTAAGGFQNGQFGQGSGTNTAIAVVGNYRGPKPPSKPKPDHPKPPGAPKPPGPPKPPKPKNP